MKTEPILDVPDDQKTVIEDLQWCYDRLSHLLFIWDNPESYQAWFGPSETMNTLAEDMDFIRERNKLTDIYSIDRNPIKH